ncbi:MAG: hypothetical protein WC343_02765 [Bacilli bacterium]|jgi:phage terminase large subunit-like protein
MRLWTDGGFRASLSEREREQYDELYDQSTSAAFDRLGAAFDDLIASIAEAYSIGRWCDRLEALLTRIRKLVQERDG